MVLNERERAVAAWVLTHNEAAGRFTDTLPQSAGFYLPVRTPSGVLGVLAALIPLNRSLRLEERQMLETFCAQLALVIERFQLQEEAARSEVEKRSRQLQKTLLDSVSHELRTPLAVIAASAERLAGSVRDDENLISEIADATRRLERVVSNLLSLTRLESGSVQPKPEWCDLQDIIEEAIASVRPDAQDRVFTVQVAPDAAMLHVDPGLLEDAFRNLVRNAAQHTPDGTPVEIDARRLDSEIQIRISDHGPGISEERREAVFEKFFRGPTARPGGLGMGLALARGFINALRGSLCVGPRADGSSGSMFTITLPAPPASHP